ncbi:MAG: PQQ-binding-like beta-propeller repeat protein [Alphaproteobacteria bacterium]|nr:PQQ-binding-like beta-propeller repeat protein [Alphaproteobacteria bacterium]
MNMRRSLAWMLLGLTLATASPVAVAQTPPDHPGLAVYNRACAACHDNPGATRAATLPVLKGTAPAQLRTVLTEGVMKPMAAGLSAEELNQLIGFLTAGQQAAPVAWTDAMICPVERRVVNVWGPAGLSSFGGDPKSTRRLSARQAGLKTQQMKDLEIAWAIGIPQTQTMGMGATVLGDTAFVNAGGRLLALDAATGCAKWVYDAGGSRNTPVIAEIKGKKSLVFANSRGEVHVVDAATGQLVWKADGKPANGVGSVRGGVVVHKDLIIVPISASGVGTGANPTFECCTGHGAVVALNATTGSKLWEYHTMKEAEYTGQVNSRGVKQRGPSGAPIWSIPTIDEKRNRVIVTTGENTSHPATDTSDAIIAIDLSTGKEAWKYQAMAADVWNLACAATKDKSGPNCPWFFDNGQGRDFDFGAQAIVATGAGGKDVILAGQKSGHVWALDADTGKVLWSQRVGEGTALGGVHWGIATDGSRVFAPINDPFPGAEGGPPRPGMYAFDIKSGKPAWSHVARPDCEGERGKLVTNCKEKYGYSVAPLVVDGALVSGTLDGKIVIFDAKSGKVLKQIDTIGPVKTSNGVEGKGGSIESHGISAGAGMIFVSSGYGSFGQSPGNVLIALKPKK